MGREMHAGDVPNKPLKSGCAVMKLVGIAVILSLVPALTFGADDFLSRYNELREQEIREFSARLFLEGEYYRSITEAKRYLLLFPEGQRAEESAKSIGDAYMMSHEWEAARSAYDDFLVRYPASPLRAAVTFYKAIALLQLGLSAEAERLFQLLVRDPDREVKSPAARWEILLLIRQNRYEEAEKRLRDRMLQPEIDKESDLIEELVREKRDARTKSPLVAGVLSAILPGAGQCYNERIEDGVYSFLLNALFLLAAYKAYDSDNTGLGILLTLFEVGWYTGGVYGAVGGAYKFNRKVDEGHFRNGMERLHLRESEIARPGGVSVIFTYPF